MSLLSQVENRDQSSVPVVRMNVQGTDGVGKSTFGAGAEAPIFIQAEDGLSFDFHLTVCSRDHQRWFGIWLLGGRLFRHHLKASGDE